MSPIFHLALLSDWQAAQRAGSYTISTRGRSLAEVGFIHASRADQWTGVRDRFYSDVTAPMVLLQIDPALLDVPVLDEPPAPGATETFPHVYGPLPVSAVVKAIPLDRPAHEAAAPSVPSAPSVPTVRPPESFSRAYFREMFFNLAVGSIVLVVGTSGMALGATLPGDAGPAVGGILGVALGAVLAVRVYRYRFPRTGR
ncbi:hypothetical protein GCM10022263_08060 [Nocardioides daeguensis]|uniref:DUF952 domain-containing protein n=2 Tax=Nocardioides daeguensis TaxID=908359 RepID=A0ABP6UVG5_9ACTN